MRARVHLCGRLEVAWDGERLEGALPGRQGRLLFAFLTLHRERLVRRDELVEAGRASYAAGDARASSRT
jgi:DNA-binding SARP family transcriptional activator